MSYIKLSKLSLDYIVLSNHSRSFKSTIINNGIRGKIISNEHLYVRALNSITCDFNSGDRVGIVGLNGSGKSTLLKVLSGIYSPSEGILQIKGSIAPMLDISLGIDESATGIENIFLRGYYLGLDKKTINSKIEDIIEFSELGTFIDMPLSTYSSGMRLRLMFSIATSFNFNILIMDEMILTGDKNFIVKSKQRLDEYLDKSDILFLASHSDAIIKEYCNKAIWLESGEVKFIGAVDSCLEKYQDSLL
ncbi:ABC transporter ATP-binding protein [Sulfurimonas sp.]|uniref:ABC transporter ATP-binding protein n=1 Tax=Sulfurimonas sp. TaxID=2022749 RepID=UPI002AAFB9AB|nr:ABC transporter ATP-binding protein [Sulfurimonas sp.]